MRGIYVWAALCDAVLYGIKNRKLNQKYNDKTKKVCYSTDNKSGKEISLMNTVICRSYGEYEYQSQAGQMYYYERGLYLMYSYKMRKMQNTV